MSDPKPQLKDPKLKDQKKSTPTETALQFVDFDHQILKRLRQHNLPEGSCVLIWVSGGADSVALVQVLARLNPVLKYQLAVFHAHHGEALDPELKQFRDQAFVFVKKLAATLQLPFYSNATESGGEVTLQKTPPQPLVSEEELRVFRYGCAAEFAPLAFPQQTSVINATGHHCEDLLETQLIQLIRGVGPQSLAQLRVGTADRLWPLSACTRLQLQSYLQTLQQDFLDDPSNACLEPLRNWMRHEWLPQLEDKRQGSLKNLAQSLSRWTLSSHPESLSHLKNSSPEATQTLDLRSLLSEPFEERVGLLGAYLKAQGVQVLSQNHIVEMLKRLDRPQQSYEFELFNECWSVHRGQLSRTTS